MISIRLAPCVRVAAINLAVRIIDAETPVPDETYIGILRNDAAEPMPPLI